MRSITCAFGVLLLLLRPWLIHGLIEKPRTNQVALSPAVVDFVSGSTNPVATDWDPNDDLVKGGGNGCLNGSVGAMIASDNSFMTLIFDRFNAEVGPYVRNKERAYCRFNVTLNAPGWTFDVDSFDFRGYYNLEAGVNASVRAKYKLIGQNVRGKIRRKLIGPVQTDFIFHGDGEKEVEKDDEDDDSGDKNEANGHPCMTNNTVLQLTLTFKIKTGDNDNLKGLVKGDATDSKFRQFVNFGWKRCTDVKQPTTSTPIPIPDTGTCQSNDRGVGFLT